MTVSEFGSVMLWAGLNVAVAFTIAYTATRTYFWWKDQHK